MTIARSNISGDDAKRICTTSVLLLAFVSVLSGIIAAMTGGFDPQWHVVYFVLVVAVAGIPGAVLAATIYVLFTKQRTAARGEGRGRESKSAES